MLIRSYVRSTDYHRKPCGENIICGVDISVMVRPTFRTIPLSDIKRQLINNVTAFSTAFRTRKPTVNFNQCPTIPLALILQLTNQFKPACISNSLSQLMVFQHILHRQVFDSNRLVFAYQSSRQLVKEIFTSIGYSCLNSSNFTPRFLSIVRAFHSCVECFLSLPQLMSKALEVFGVGNFLPVTGGNQGGDSRINSYCFIELRQELNGMVFNQQRDKPTSRCIQPHCSSGRLTPFRERATPFDGQRFRTFRQPQLPILPPKGRTGKLSAAATPLFLEVGILGTTCPEVGEGFLQVSQSLLQGYAAYFIEKLQVFLLFPLGKHPGCLLVINALLAFIPGFCPSMQRFVVNQPDATQCAAQELFLFRCWVKAVSVGTLSHGSHTNTFPVKPSF